MEQIQIVQQILAVFAILYLLVEILLNLNDIDNDTSNIIIFQWTEKHGLIFIPFALGAIGGHLFLGTSNSFFYIENSLLPVAILVIISVALLFTGLSLIKKSGKVSKWLISLLLVSGFAYGHFLWSMNYETLPENNLPANVCRPFQYSCPKCNSL